MLVNRLPDPGPVVIGDDAALNQLAQSCFDGDMGACDDLFLDSPVASAYEDYGNTCGGRIDEAEVDARYCVDIVVSGSVARRFPVGRAPASAGR